MTVQDSLREFEALAARQKQVADAKRAEVTDKFGSPAAFMQQLDWGTVNRDGDPAFPQIYALYEKIFTLPEERDTAENLQSILEVHHDANNQARFGPSEECWIYARDPATKEVVGAVNIVALGVTDPEAAKHADATMHINYLFVDPKYRTMGLGRHLLERADARARDIVAREMPDKSADTLRLFTFTEQNSPAKMTMAEYMQDNLSAGIDQCDRRNWWERQGYNQIDFPYVQPALSEDQDPCTGLDLCVKGAEGAKLPSSLLKYHFHRWASCSIMGGEDANEDETFRSQRRYLDRRPTVPLMPQSSRFTTMKSILMNQVETSPSFFNMEDEASLEEKMPVLTDVFKMRNARAVTPVVPRGRPRTGLAA